MLDQIIALYLPNGVLAKQCQKTESITGSLHWRRGILFIFVPKQSKYRGFEEHIEHIMKVISLNGEISHDPLLNPVYDISHFKITEHYEKNFFASDCQAP